jgi:hypothetical protein
VLTSLKEKLIKIAAKLVSHGRYVAFQMAEVAKALLLPVTNKHHRHPASRRTILASPDPRYATRPVFAALLRSESNSHTGCVTD